eukprot:11239165-Alexandrium_andersonii.AAC.1
MKVSTARCSRARGRRGVAAVACADGCCAAVGRSRAWKALARGHSSSPAARRRGVTSSACSRC